MPSTYSNLKIQLMATGENNTTWGDVTNLNLGTALEEAIVGSADVTFASGDVTLTLTDTNASQTARNMRLRCTGTTGGARNLIVPSIEKPYIVKNDCADSVTVKTAAGTGIAVPAGKTMWVYSDGTNVVDAVTHLSSLTLGTDLSVADGGTGASTFTANGVLYGNGASALQVTAAGTTGQVLVGNTGSAPSWATLTSTAVTSISFGTTGLTPSTATQGAVTVAGTLGVANGGTGTATQFTAGSVVFAGASGVYTQDNAQLFWDNSNDRLGIGTATPSALLTVSNGGAAGYEVNPTGGVGGGATVATYNRNTSAYTSLTTYSSTMTWYANGTTRAMDLDSSGNLGIGTSAPTAYSGYTSLEIDNASNGGILSIKKAGSVVGYLNGASGLLLLAQSNDLKLTTTGSTSMQFSTNASERMRIDTSGNVGIGTSTPNAKLDVVGNVIMGAALTTGTGVSTGDVQVELGANRTGDGPCYIDWHSTAGTDFESRIVRNSGTNGTMDIVNTGTGGINLSNFGSAPITLATGGIDRMRITSTGDVGIGVTPLTRLDVSTSGGSRIRTDTSSASLTVQTITNAAASAYVTSRTDAADYQIYTTGSEKMRIDSSGNVGIGTSAPGAGTRLNVAGRGLFTGGALDPFDGTASGVGISYDTTNNIGNIASVQTGVTERQLNISANPITFRSAGSERMRIDSGGNVGIGTNSPNGRLTIKQGAAQVDITTSSADVTFESIDRGNLTAVVDTRFFTRNGKYQWFTGAYSESMRLDSSGNLGIGTSSPSVRLDIAGADAAFRATSANAYGDFTNGSGTLRLQVSGPDGFITQTNAGSLIFRTNATERMRITDAGNLQLGTASLATNATNGFPYIPTCAGTPTGTPTAITGYAPMVVDSTNNKLYVYVGGAWQAMN